MGMGSNVLQGKILFFVFGKVQGLGLYGDSLAGVIGKTHTFIRVFPLSLFAAEDAVILGSGAVKTQTAAAIHFFAKKHIVTSYVFFIIIHHRLWKCYRKMNFLSPK